jgi:hypothetical protein
VTVTTESADTKNDFFPVVVNGELTIEEHRLFPHFLKKPQETA